MGSYVEIEYISQLIQSVLIISKSGSNKTPKDIFYLKFQLLKMERKTFNSPPRSQKYRLALAKCL
jgi:hypothetical protein